jgi:hypothetical protein
MNMEKVSNWNNENVKNLPCSTLFKGGEKILKAMETKSNSNLGSLWGKKTRDNLSFLGKFFREIGKKLDNPLNKLAK